MQLEWFRSATVGLTSPSGVTVLCDPWITDGAFIGSWFHWPPLEGFEFDELVARRWDFVYISHLHADHFDRRLVAEIARRQPWSKAIVADFSHPWLRGAVERCGFTGDRLLVASDQQRLSLGDLEVTVRTADACDPTVCGTSTPCSPLLDWNRAIDSVALFESGGVRVLHANDALAVASSAEVLGSLGRVDVLLGHYGGAGPFPQAFPDVVDKPAHARRLAYQFLHRLAAAAELVGARYVMPFAGQYQLGGHLASLNANRSVVPLDEAVSWLEEHCSATAISLQPFRQVSLRDGELGTEWVEPSDEVLSGYLVQIERLQYPYERENESWPDAHAELSRAFQRVARRYDNRIRSGLKMDLVSVEIVADPALAIVAAGGSDFAEHALTLDFGADRLEGGVDCEPRSESLTRISVDPRLLRRLLVRSPEYRGFTQMHWNQAEIGSHLRWRRWGAYNPTAHSFLNFLA